MIVARHAATSIATASPPRNSVVVEDLKAAMTVPINTKTDNHTALSRAGRDFILGALWKELVPSHKLHESGG